MKKNTNEYINQDNHQTILSIPLWLILVSFIIIILLIIISFNICAIISNKNENLLESNNIENANNDNENEIIVVGLFEETEEISSDIQEDFPEDNKENANIITYTASNGKTYNIIATLNIPSLSINYPILSETSNELLKVSLNKYWGANPNEVGNMVVVGHNYKNNKFFSNLHNIKLGEIVKITDLTGRTLDYEVYDTYVVDQYDNACTSQLTDGQTEITLITCYYENGNIHATKRFVAKARAN